MVLPKRGADRATALVAVALFLYVALRAACVPIVHDEAFSYRNFAGRSFATILSSETPEPANNHVLNSLLVRVAALALGPSEWTLRLPNVLAFALFLVCGIALVRRFSGSAPRVCGFLLFAGNPFLLELFSLSRGYGLGLAFLAAALLAFVRAEEAPDSARRDLLLGGLSGFLAVFANLAFLLPVLALLGVVVVRNRRVLRRWAPFLAVAPLLVVAILGPRIVALKRAGQFYAGGTKGFFADTVGSLVRITEEGANGGPLVHAIVVTATVGLLLLALVGILAPSLAGGGRIARVAGSVLLLAATGSVAQHFLLGTPYLEDRTAIFFVPLLALGAAAGLDALGASPRSPARIAGRTFAGVLAALALALLARSANVDRTTLWRYDADVRRVVDDLTALHAEGLGRIRIGGNWVFEPALNFYRETRRLEWLEPIVRNDALDRCNVVLTSVYDRVPVPEGEFLKRRGFSLSGNVLLVRVHPAGSGRTPREDPSLPGSLDEPVDGAVVSGSLRIRGWAREPGQDLAVSILIDGIPSAAPVTRVPRPDVAAALPSLADCSGAGWELTIPLRPGDAGRHTVEVVFTSADGRERHYAVRRFTWRK